MRSRVGSALILLAILCAIASRVEAEPRKNGYASPSSMHGLLARVSGSGQRGFKDGRFWEAMFDMPRSLVVDGEGRYLYVADTANNRVRRIDLVEDGKTETLAGTGESRELDGAFQVAAFARPTLVAMASPEALVVYDAGPANLPVRSFRTVHLREKTVSTIPVTLSGAPLGEVADMTSAPTHDVLFFVVAGGDGVFALNANTGEVKQLSAPGDGIPNRPASITMTGDKLSVLGGTPRQVVELDLSAWNFNENKPCPARILAQTADAVSIRAAGDLLYILQRGQNCLSILSRNVVSPLPVVNAWGQTIACNEGMATKLIQGEEGAPALLTVDPINPRRLFFVSVDRSSIEVFRDYGQAFLLPVGSGPIQWMPDISYPEKKEAGVYRVLLMGDSRVFHQGIELESTTKMNKFDTLAKQIEIQLNLSASLQGSKRRFEVLSLAETSGYSMFTWGYYRAPEIVRKYDIDMTIVSMLYPPSLQNLLYRPLPGSRFETSEEPGGDGEYAVSSDVEKVQDGPLKPLYDGLVADKLIIEHAGGKLEFPPLGPTCGAPHAREGLFTAYSTMFSNIARKVENAKPAGSSQSNMLLLLAPPGLLGLPTCLQEMMTRMSQDSKVPFLDLAPVFTATGTTFYSAFGRGEDHLTKDGYHLYGDVIAEALLQSGHLE